MTGCTYRRTETTHEIRSETLRNEAYSIANNEHDARDYGYNNQGGGRVAAYTLYI